jgi:hypothetical protein
MVLNLRPKCANPSCAASFERMAGGQLFRYRRDPMDLAPADGMDGGTNASRPTGHFWLCERCSNVYTLHYETGRGVVIDALRPELSAAQNNMHLPAS